MVVALSLQGLCTTDCSPEDFAADFVERLCKPLSCCSAAMRKLLHIVYGVLKSGKPFDPKLALAR